MLWTEKYRPKMLHHLIGQESFKLDAENWIELRDMPNVLLHGPAGVGKTAAAGILALEILKREIDSNFFEISISSYDHPHNKIISIIFWFEFIKCISIVFISFICKTLHLMNLPFFFFFQTPQT